MGTIKAPTKTKEGNGEMKSYKVRCNRLIYKNIESAWNWQIRCRRRYSVPTDFLVEFEYTPKAIPVSSKDVAGVFVRRVYVTANERYYVEFRGKKTDVTDFCKGRINFVRPTCCLGTKNTTREEKSEQPSIPGLEDLEDKNLSTTSVEKVVETTSGHPSFVFQIALTAIIILILLFVFFSKANAFEINDQLLNAIATVESNNKDNAIGDDGKALGRYQIWNSYVKDANRIGKYNFKHGDVKDQTKARKIMVTYLNHYGKRYERLTGKKVTPEILARIHNGGPDGWKKQATLKYWTKVEKEINK